MKNGKLSLLLILSLLIISLTVNVFGYYDHEHPRGVQIPVVLIPELEEAEVEPELESGEGHFFEQIPVVIVNDRDQGYQGSGTGDQVTEEPSATATLIPTATATLIPTETATEIPTATATEIPTATATEIPTATATEVPTATPTDIPTATATEMPIATATVVPTATEDRDQGQGARDKGIEVPTAIPTDVPTAVPTEVPTVTAEDEYPDINAELEAAEEHYASYSKKQRADAQKLLKTADEKIFPRKGYTWDFSEAQGYVNEILEPGIIHQWYIYYGRGSDVLMSMFPAAAGVRTGNQRLDLTKGLEDEFHASYSLQRTEDLPAGAGGRCWMRYDNSVQKGDLSEAGVILFPGYKAFSYHTDAGKRSYTAIADLSGLDQDEVLKFDFIRMDGVCYFYANGDFLFSYEDEVIGSVSFEGGAEIFKGGNRIHCEFDDFAMTYR